MQTELYGLVFSLIVQPQHHGQLAILCDNNKAEMAMVHASLVNIQILFLLVYE